MANVNRPSGFAPVRGLVGNWTGQANLYYIPSTDGSQYNIGDIVQSAAGADANGIAQILKPATSTSGFFRGVIIGFQINPSNLTVLNVPATKTQAYYAWVVDDPNVILECTDDGITTANFVAASVGLNTGFTVANPTAPSPVSASVLTSSTFQTTNTLPLKILGLDQRVGNGFGAYARWLVKFNGHELNAAQTTAP